MEKTAIVDIDNTLWQFCDALYEELRKINCSFPAPEHWTDWDLWQGHSTEAEFLGAINRVHFRQDSSEYRPYPEAEGFLGALKEHGYHIIIASHRSHKTFDMTKNWLETNNLIYDDLHLSYDKTTLFNMFTHVVVDDAPQTLEKAHQMGLLATGLKFPWNQAAEKDGLKLFDTLDGVLGHVIKGK